MTTRHWTRPGSEGIANVAEPFHALGVLVLVLVLVQLCKLHGYLSTLLEPARALIGVDLVSREVVCALH